MWPIWGMSMPDISMPAMSSAKAGVQPSNRARAATRIIGSTGVATEEIGQLGEFLAGAGGVAAFDGMRYAMIGMRFQDFVFDLAQGRLDGLHLVENLDAIA